MRTMKRRLCAILCAALLAGALVPTVSAASFTDTFGHWAADYIEACAGRGIVDGVGGGKFEPEGKVTNAQFTKMLCSAFYSAEEQDFERENYTAIDNYFGGSLPWYGARSYYFKELGLLNGVDYDIQTANSANRSMTRNNMAQVAANVLAQKGITASEADLTAAQAAMPDYDTIPEASRQAVKTCYALRIINGIDGGKFDGAATMTRAQACAVITRMLDVVHKGHTDPDPTPSAPDEPTIKDVQVSSAYWSGSASDAYGKPTTTSGQAWTVTDNGNPDGYLNNGKPITPENVIELLAQAEKVWPTGIRWANYGANNNFYKSSGSVVSRMMKTPNTGLSLNAGTNFGCSGYAAMISDYLFGRDVNDFHRVTDVVNGIRPGDIILMIDTDGSRVVHAMVATSANFVEYEGNGTPHPGFVYITDGNNGEKINWPGKYDSGVSEANDSYAWQVYSRYPD